MDRSQVRPTRLKKSLNNSNKGAVAVVLLLTLVCSSNIFFFEYNLGELIADSEAAVNIASSNNEDKITIFYNVFTSPNADSAERSRVNNIVLEQLQQINPNIHNIHVQITSIGHPFQVNSINEQLNLNATIREHLRTGDEGDTLHALWKYCQSHPNSKVIYIHSKGSFHFKPWNERLRKFLTEGALSQECATLPTHCNVCSSRMSPLPHEHTPGNMFLSRCDYISKHLIDPKSERKEKTKSPWCDGEGRFFFEHWIHSHPVVHPCDLYPGKEYAWGYANVPDTNLTKELSQAPRFQFDVYNQGYNLKTCQNTREGYFKKSIERYSELYGIVNFTGGWQDEFYHFSRG